MLDLSKMQRSEIIKLLMQIESHCDHSVFSKSAFVFNQILLGAASIELGSEEQLMTDKLEMQFSATHFVPLVTGTKLLGARYTILTQIASGGMSAVYAAQMSSGDEKKSRHTNVVLKECVLPLNTDQKTRNKAKELFAREATTLAKLDYPQIVRVLDSFVQNEREYIVLKYSQDHSETGQTAHAAKRSRENSRVGASNFADTLLLAFTPTASNTPRSYAGQSDFGRRQQDLRLSILAFQTNSSATPPAPWLENKHTFHLNNLKAKQNLRAISTRSELLFTISTPAKTQFRFRFQPCIDLRNETSARCDGEFDRSSNTART